MTQQVYTIGYGGKTPDQLKEIVEQKDAVIFDIRFRPASRQVQWAKKNVLALMGADRYQHIKALGNINYKNGGPIKFVNFEAGVRTIEQSDKPVVLMCVCKDVHQCHRTVAAKQLQSLGFKVSELDQPPQPSRPQFVQTTFWS